MDGNHEASWAADETVLALQDTSYFVSYAPTQIGPSTATPDMQRRASKNSGNVCAKSPRQVPIR